MAELDLSLQNPDALVADTGLEWPGPGATRRCLYWLNPPPIYPMTYIFKVFPRKKLVPPCPNAYWTTFFWGNFGRFDWDAGSGNTYYGAHPYPVSPPDGPGQWEISVFSGDEVTGTEVTWNRWYTQAFRAWRVDSDITEHEFYYDLPDTTKIVTKEVNFPTWANTNPPTPSIVMGQAPDYLGNSWGGYPGWEEFQGVIRGIQIYSGLLTLAEIQQEINSPKSSANGASLIWYLNMNPRPGDVTDKKATGTPHHPSWDGVASQDWALKPDSGGGSEGSMREWRSDDQSTLLGWEINATSPMRVYITVGARSIDRVCAAGQTTIQLGPTVALTRVTNWKGESVLIPATAIDVGLGSASGPGQPPGTVIL